MRAPLTIQKLKMWQKSMDLVEACYRISTSFPRDERFGLLSQIKRAATSIPANIAEGYGRWNVREFARFLAIANGSLRELETHILIAKRLGYVAPGAATPILESAAEVARMIYAMRLKIQSRLMAEKKDRG
jgi:four helix bundle protein